jgi:glycosyltransferase involved in cell wall biosynthesis
MLVYRAFFWSADASVFVCEAQRRHWARRGVFSRRSAVIYNGVDTDEFRDRWSSAERQALRTALGFTESDYVVGIAARLRPEKNHLQLVDAIAQLRGRGVAARALLIGDGEMRAAIEARAHERDVHRHVVITGFKPDVRPYLVACDVATLVSHTEAFSLAAIESMALARPLVHSDVGGAAEMIRPGRSGFLFPPGDTAALVDRLRTLADPSQRARMGAEARAAAEAHFSEAAMVDRYERLLFELAPAGALVSEAA